MAFVFNKSIAYIGNSDDPNTLNIIPVDAAGKCMTLDGTKEWNYDNSLPAGTRWISRTGGGVTSVKVTKFLTSGTWNVDPNTKFMIIDMIGGGGGGSNHGATPANSIGMGITGNAGNRVYGIISKTDLPLSSYAITIGTGGSSGSGATFVAGGHGSETSIGTAIVAKGGKGGYSSLIVSGNILSLTNALTNDANVIPTGFSSLITDPASYLTPNDSFVVRSGSSALIRRTRANTPGTNDCDSQIFTVNVDTHVGGFSGAAVSRGAPGTGSVAVTFTGTYAVSLGGIGANGMVVIQEYI